MYFKNVAALLSPLQSELKQARPFHSPQQEALLSILRTAALLRHRITASLDPHGLSPEQYNVLRILRGAGESGLPTLEVAARLIEPTPAITRLLDKLEAKKLVRRRRCADDRRQVLCWITGAGSDLLNKLDPLFAGSEHNLLAMLDAEDLQRLISLLNRVRAPLQPCPRTEKPASKGAK
jgi:DNA-binding MarR family transcriptional regulator